MTEFDQAYIHKRIDHKDQDDGDYCAETSLGGYLVGAIAAVVLLAYLASYIVAGLLA